MTVTTGEKKRVVIPSARPGDRFDVQMTLEGKVVLTRLELADKPDHVRLVKKHGYTVARQDFASRKLALPALESGALNLRISTLANSASYTFAVQPPGC